MHRVVRPFPVSWDGLTLVDLIAGDERDFGEMTAGLLAEGYIEPVSGAPVVVAERLVVDPPAVDPVLADIEPASRRGRPRKS